MAAPNFDFKAQVDPTAFVAAMQRKAQMEFEMKSADQREKDARFGRILDAVQTGQQIASNMMKQASDRSKVEGQKKLQEILGEPTQSAPVAASIPQFKRAEDGQVVPAEKTSQPTFADTDRGASQMSRLQQALMQANPEKYTGEMIDSQFARDRARQAAAGDTTIEPMLFPDNTVKNVIVNKFDNTMRIAGTQELIPPALASQLQKGFAPAVIRDEMGNVITAPKAVGRNATQVGSESKTDALNEGGMPALQASSPALAERFSKAREQAFPEFNQGLKESVDASASAAVVEAILAQKDISEVGLRSLGFHLARMSGSNSQLSDAERQTFERAMSLYERFKNEGYKAVVGDFSPKFKADLKNLSATLAKKERLRADKALARAKANARSQIGQKAYDRFGLETEFPTLNDLIVQASEFSDPNEKLTPRSDPKADINAINNMTLEQLKKRRDELLKKRNQ